MFYSYWLSHSRLVILINPRSHRALYLIIDRKTNISFYAVELFGAFQEKDEALKEKKMNDIKEEILPFYMGRLDAIAGENDGHLANGQVCHR